MKIFYLFILIIYLFIQGIDAQEFSFKISFSDAVGNKDTLLLGYDFNATDSVDFAFEENNIINIGWDSKFEVRVSNEWKSRVYYNKESGDYHLKKQIVEKICDSLVTPIAIDIKCNNWPVTATWDSLLFDDTCRLGSIFTGLNEGMWWDVSGPSDLYITSLRNNKNVLFTSNVNNQFNENNVAETSYLTDQQDTISVFWIVFGDPLGVGIDKKNAVDKITIFPNPTSDKFYILNTNQIKIDKILIYDIFGKLVMVELQNKEYIDLSNLKNGIYTFCIITFDKRKINGKVIKYP